MDAENHEVKMLPPYCPMLNPIEEAFSCLKAKVKQLLNESMEIILDRAAAAAAQQPVITLLKHLVCLGHNTKFYHPSLTCKTYILSSFTSRS